MRQSQYDRHKVRMIDVFGPYVCTGCCSQMISGMFSEVAHMYPAC
jgi:hypothetical protein